MLWGNVQNVFSGNFLLKTKTAGPKASRFPRIEPEKSGFDWRAPVVCTGSTGNGMLPGYLAVGQGNGYQLGEVSVGSVLAVGHVAVDVDDGGIFQDGGEEVLLLAFYGSAVPLELYFRQHFAGSQGVVHQRGGFVQGGSELERLVHALAGRLTGLGVSRNGDNVAEFLNQHFVFVTFNVDVAYGIGSECASGDVALSFTFDADITRSWHSLLHDVLVNVCPRGVPWTGCYKQALCQF